jgi:hypothetical protein
MKDLDRLTARLVRQHNPPVYWPDARGRWIAYHGRGIYELGTWERAAWVSHRRIQPAEEWAT